MTDFRASCLQGDDRFAQLQCPVGQAGKLFAVLDAFQVADDHSCVGILQQVLHEVQRVEVHLVAGAGDTTETDARFLRQIEDSVTQGAALCDVTDRADSQGSYLDRSAETSDHVFLHVDRALAVGTHDPHAGRSGQFGDLFLESLPLVAGFGESGTEDRDKLDAFFRALFQHGQNKLIVHGDEHQIDRLGHIQNARVALESPQLFILWVDWEDLALIAVLFQITERFAADAAKVARRPDDGYGTGAEEVLQVSGCLGHEAIQTLVRMYSKRPAFSGA